MAAPAMAATPKSLNGWLLAYLPTTGWATSTAMLTGWWRHQVRTARATAEGQKLDDLELTPDSSPIS